MTGEQALSEREIFQRAVSLPAHERAAYLNAACSDAVLRGELESLLEAHDVSDSFLDAPAFELTPEVLGISGENEHVVEQPGTNIGPYKLLQQIGEGGFGVVFMSEQDRPVRRTVALKIIKPGMDTRQVIARFEAERQALAMMDHPNIARVLDAGSTEAGRPYFVMELVKGVPITAYSDQQRLSVRQRLELFTEVCHAVQHAHQKGVIHRDLKPSNVLVAEYDGEPVPKIIDFGVAKATVQRLTERTMFTQFGQLIGTLEYMSPEQARFNQLDIDTRSDIYSLGVILYELLTGGTPFARTRLETQPFDETLRIIREEEPPAPSTKLQSSGELRDIAAQRKVEPERLRRLVCGELDWIVMKALEKDRSRRYETARGLARDVERYLANEPVEAGPPSTRYRFGKFARRNKGPLIAAALVVVTLIAATIISVWQATLARRAEALAAARLKSETGARQQASAISDTLQQMLQSADPSSKRGADYTVRQMLDEFSAGLADKLHNQPATEAAVHAIIGETYRQLGLTEKAEPHLKTALDLRRKEFGSENQLVARSLMDYAWLGYARGEAGEAERYAREALAVQHKLGDRDPDLLLANMHLLQVCLAAQRRYDEAEKVAEQALAVSRRERQPLAGEASILRDLAGMAIAQKDLPKAERLAREALNLHRRLQGEQHFATAAGWETLGNVLYHQRKFAEAEKCYRQAMAIFVKTHGYCPINVLTLLAVILDAREDQSGLDALRPIADAEEVAAGPSSWQKTVTRGSLRAKLGDWSKAEDYLGKAVAAPPEDAADDCAWADSLLALLRLRAGDEAGYRATCRAALERQSALRNPAYYFVVWASVIAPDSGTDPRRLVKLAEIAVESNPSDPDCLAAIGAALYRDDQFEEAKSKLLEAVAAYDSSAGVRRGTVINAQLFLAMVSSRLHDPESARQWLHQASATIEAAAIKAQGDYGGMSWDRRFTAQLLRNEAEELLTNNDDEGSGVNSIQED